MFKFTSLFVIALFGTLFLANCWDKPETCRFFTTEDSLCIAKCPPPLTSKTEAGKKYCESPCELDKFVYPDRSCAEKCPDDLVETKYGNYKVCTSPCSPSTKYLLPSTDSSSSSCSTKCPSTWTKHSGSGINLCSKVCPPNEYADETGKCSSCDAPRKIEEFCCGISTCNLPCKAGLFVDIKGLCTEDCGSIYKEGTKNGVDVCEKPCVEGEIWDIATTKCIPIDECPPVQFSSPDGIVEVCSDKKGNVMLATIKFAISLDDFNAKDGATLLKNNVASILKVQPAQVRVFNVRSAPASVSIVRIAAGRVLAEGDGVLADVVVTPTSDSTTTVDQMGQQLDTALNPTAMSNIAPITGSDVSTVPTYQGDGGPCPGQVSKNGVCVPDCGSLWKEGTNAAGFRVCNKPCDSGLFDTENDQCMPSCDAPGEAGVIDEVDVCNFPIEAPFGYIEGHFQYDMTMADFNAQGGYDGFRANLAARLDLTKGAVRIVSLTLAKRAGQSGGLEDYFPTVVTQIRARELDAVRMFRVAAAEGRLDFFGPIANVVFQKFRYEIAAHYEYASLTVADFESLLGKAGFINLLCGIVNIDIAAVQNFEAVDGLNGLTIDLTLIAHHTHLATLNSAGSGAEYTSYTPNEMNPDAIRAQMVYPISWALLQQYGDPKTSFSDIFRSVLEDESVIVSSVRGEEGEQGAKVNIVFESSYDRVMTLRSFSLDAFRYYNNIPLSGTFGAAF